MSQASDITRLPLVAAEQVVAWEKVNDHILRRRAELERECWPEARTFSFSLAINHGVPSQRALDDLERALKTGVGHSWLFGYRSVLEELKGLRERRGDRPRLQPADGGVPSDGAVRELGHLSLVAAREYSDAAHRAWIGFARDENVVDPWAKLEKRSRMLLHNVALQIVGRALNLGRAHGARGGSLPRTLVAAVEAPALWAMRSEQLDTNTCVPCDEIHGRVVRVDDPLFYDLMPPNLCLGRGRCRGIYVFGDSPDDFS